MAVNSRLRFGAVEPSEIIRGGTSDQIGRITIGSISSGNTTVSSISDISGYRGLEFALPGMELFIITGTTPSTFTTKIVSVNVAGNSIVIEDSPGFNASNCPTLVRALPKGMYFFESSSLTVPNNAGWDFRRVTGSLDDNYDATAGKDYGVIGQLAFTTDASSLIGGMFGQYKVLQTHYRTNSELSFFATASTGALIEDTDQTLGSGQSIYGLVELSDEFDLATIFNGDDVGSATLDSLGLSTYNVAISNVIDTQLANASSFPFTGSAQISSSLGVTGSAQFIKDAGSSGDFFLIKSSSFESLKTNVNGVVTFGDFNALPTAVAGGFAYSASNFYAGIE